jgi:Domain of unknown function (DUF1937)
MSDGFVYLAAPYTHESQQVQADRARQISVCAAALLADGFNVYSPISHGVALETASMDVGDHRVRMFSHARWLEICKPMVDAAERLFVLPLPGYMDSKGLAMEIEWAKTQGKKVVLLSHLVQGLLDRRPLGFTTTEEMIL